MTAKQAPSPAAGSWSQYWASGALHSCPNAFAGNYDDDVLEHWRSFFSTLPDGARILDVGTGNGAVAFLARDTAEGLGRKFHIEGIDAAVIDPAAAAARHGIDVGSIAFRGETSIEHTGYPERHFDAVSSQYAIEYSNVADSLRELARILKPGGRAAFVMHHAASKALEATHAELRAFAYLRDDAPVVYESCLLLKDLLGAGSASDLALRMQDGELRKQDEKIQKLLREIAAFARSQPGAAFVNGLAQQVAATLRRTVDTGPAAALERLALLAGEMAAHQSRLLDIARVALGPQEVTTFCEQAALAGFTVDAPRELMRRGEELVGWTCFARRES